MLKLAALLRNEEGNALIPVIMVSLLVGVLAALTLTTGEQADWASAKDRNHEIALGVTEAGVHEAISRVEERITGDFINTGDLGTADSPLPGGTEEGQYEYFVARDGDSIVIDAVGTVATGMRQQRRRHVKVTLEPPELFPGAGYALFSKTSLHLEQHNEVYDGDVWANDSFSALTNTIIDGSVTSAQSWIRLENGSSVTGYAWAGGRRCDVDGQNPCTSGWGISLGSGPGIGKWAKSSVSAPDCAGENPNAYKVVLDGPVGEDVTSLGSKQGAGTVGGTIRTGVCTSAEPRKDPPAFTFNRWNYDQTTYHEYGSAAAFNLAVKDNLGGINNQALEGTFVITECDDGIVDISRQRIGQDVQIAGDVTIITNPVPCGTVKGARIRTEGIDDRDIPAGEKARLVLVSHYEPPAGSPCSDKDDTYCAISAKNHFDSTCKTATLVYADNGPVSMKNDTGANDNMMCGSIIVHSFPTELFRSR